MSDSTRRRTYPLDVKPGSATPQGGRPAMPPAPGAVRSPQLPGKTPDRSAVPGHGRLPVPKNARPTPPLTEFGTAQQIMGVFALEPGEEDSKERWEQETAAYEEMRKDDPRRLTPIRPARSFVGVEEGLAAKSLIAAEELVPLPAEAVSAAGAPSPELKGDPQATQTVPQAATPPPSPIETPAPAAPVTPTAAATEPVPGPVNPTAPANVEVPANPVTVAEGLNTSGQTPGPAAAGGTAPATSPTSAPAASTDPINPKLARIPQTGWVAGDGSATCPSAYPIKGNATAMIYHTPGLPSYQATIPELCFGSEDAAQAAGFRPPRP